MRFKVIRNQTELSFTDILPPKLLAYKVFPQTFSASESWGSIIFQGITTRNFTISYCQYIISEESSFNIQSSMETINLYMAYKNNLYFDTVGLGEVKLNEAQFNLTYLPGVISTGHFAPGNYELFDISYNIGYLNRFIPHLPGLKQFIFNSEMGISSHLHHTHPYASCEMMEVVGEIIQYDYNNGLNNIFVECKAMELLMHAVEKMAKENNKKLKLNGEDSRTFENIRTWLNSNIDYAGSLGELALLFNVNEFKLKKGFKEIYGVTIFELLLKLRMERARQMLLETNLSVTEIGYRAGYSSGSHFSDAFRKHFGYPPTFLRKK